MSKMYVPFNQKKFLDFKLLIAAQISICLEQIAMTLVFVPNAKFRKLSHIFFLFAQIIQLIVIF